MEILRLSGFDNESSRGIIANIDKEHKLDEDVIKLIIEAAMGNPGCLTVLSSIAIKEPTVIRPLILALDMTESRSSTVWVVYKEICKYDLNETIKYLKTWYQSSLVNLDNYID